MRVRCERWLGRQLHHGWWTRPDSYLGFVRGLWWFFEFSCDGSVRHQRWVSRWWFQICFIFTSIWGRFPFWLIFFKWVWSNYSDLTRPHPKWWFSKGNPLISVKSRLVKYYNLARMGWNHQPGIVLKSGWRSGSGHLALAMLEVTSAELRTNDVALTMMNSSR